MLGLEFESYVGVVIVEGMTPLLQWPISFVVKIQFLQGKIG
jgi:hypothetical protein